MNDDKIRQALARRRNIQPEHGIRVPLDEMESFITALFVRAGLREDDAGLMGRLLSANDLRCVFSHGTLAVGQYLHHLREGGINPRPEIKTVHEAPGSLVLDGDGGLGYFPCWRGTERIVAKAKETGCAVLTTRNHHHFGSAGHYARLAVEHGCIGLVASNHRTERDPEVSIYSTVTSSPISIAIPSGGQPPFIMDMGSALLRMDDEAFAANPGAFFKGMGLSNAVQLLGGAVAGIYLQHCVQGQYISNQGAFVAVFDADRLMPPGQVGEEVGRYVGEARKMQPLPGTDAAELSGGTEWSWEQENRKAGVPLDDDHRAALERHGAEWGVESPFGRFEDTRF